MMRLLFVVALLFILAGVIVEARYLMESPYSRLRSLLERASESSVLVPQRQLRQVVDYQPLPCRWKLCASYY